MAKQINQYTKTRTSGTIQDDDYLDLDSTEDSGTTFESAKLKVSQFLTYLSDSIPTFYKANGGFTIGGGDRTVAMNENKLIFDTANDIELASGTTVTDFAYVLKNRLGVEQGRLGLDDINGSGYLELKNIAGTYLKAYDGQVGIGTASPTAKLHVDGDFLVEKSVGVDVFKIENDGNIVFTQTTDVGGVAVNVNAFSGGNFKFGSTAGRIGMSMSNSSGSSTALSLIPSLNSYYLMDGSNGMFFGATTNTSGINARVFSKGGGSAACYVAENVFGTSRSVIENSNGNSGIGTATPTAKLHVDGSLRIDTATASAIGEVWTATDVLGNGEWAAAGGGSDGNGIFDAANDDATLSSNFGFRVADTLTVKGVTGADVVTFNSSQGLNVGNGTTSANLIVDTSNNTPLSIKRSGIELVKVAYNGANPTIKMYDQLAVQRVNINCEAFVGDTYFNHLGNTGFGLNNPTAKLHVKTSTSAGSNNAFLVSNNITDLLTVKDDGNTEIKRVGIGSPAESNSRFFLLTSATDLYGLKITASSLLNNGSGIRLVSTGATNNTGSYFQSSLTSGAGLAQGVFGRAIDVNPSAAYGVKGEARNGTSISLGVLGEVLGGASVPASNKTAAVLGVNNSTNSTNNYGGHFSCTGIGTSVNSIGGYFEAINGTNNYAILTPSGGGDIGFGTLTPTARLHVQTSTSAGLANAFLVQNNLVGGDLLTVKDDGNVGIGTASPSAKLEVDGGDFKVRSTSTNEFFLIDYSADRIGINNDIQGPKGTVDIKGVDSLSTSYSLYVQNGGNLPTLRVNNLFGVGIGSAHTASSTIDANLHVKSAGGKIAIFEANNTNLDAEVTILQSAAAGTKSSMLKLENDLGTTFRLISYGSNITAQPFLADKQALQYTTDLLFNIGNTTQAILTNSGQLGIGTATPTEKLDVVGNANVSGTYNVGGVAGFTGTGAYTNFTIVGGIITAAS